MNTILVVDDFDLDRKVLSTLLSHEGFAVREARNGVEALQTLEREPIAAIVSDILMPDMDGYRLCVEVRRSEKFGAVPFIFHTSTYTSPTDETLAMELGADKFLRKPVPGRKIVEAIRQLLVGPPHVPTAGYAPEDLDKAAEYTERLVAKLEEKNEEVSLQTQVLHAASAKLGTVIDAAPVAIISCDREGKIETWNAGTERILGWTEKEVRGSHIPDLGTGKAESEALRQQLLAERASSGVALSVQRRDGAQVYLEFSGTPLLGADGEPKGKIIVLADCATRHRAHDFYKSLFNDFPALIWQAGLDARCSYFNQTWLDFTGRSLEQERGDGWLAGVHLDDVENVMAKYLAAFAGREPFVLEYRLRRYDGVYREIIDHGRPYSPGGLFAGYIGSCYDDTERRESERARHSSEERFRRYFEMGLVGMTIVSPKQTFLEVNDRFCEMLGRSREELLHATWAEVTHPDNIADSLAQYNRVLAGEIEGYILDKRYLHKDGSIVEATTSARCLRGPGGTIDCIVGLVQDTNAIRHSQAELEKSRIRLEMLSRRLLETREIELRRIARELHDEIGQTLTAAKLEIAAAKRLTDFQPLLLRLDDSDALIDHLLQSVRTLSLELRPALLDEVGLVAALDSHVRSLAQRSGLAIRFQAPSWSEPCPSSIEIACFRVAQEALTNIVRHAQAQAVEIELGRTNERVRLSIRDDGIGFDPAAASASAESGASLGLVSMRERVELARGRFVCRSAAGQGTEIEAYFTVSETSLGDEMSP